jgi:hypothetical protein
MKKLIFAFSFVACLFMMSCSCEKNKPVNNTETTDSAALVVENVTGMDRQKMFQDFGKDYRWFETCIVLKDYLDSEETDGTVTGISNIFQVVVEKDNGADVRVVMFTHVGDSTQVDVANSFWVEDFPMNEDAIKLTFKDAYDRVMAANAPKPHSRQVVLRKEVGPNSINPQYIFGNSQAQLYVDAVTGDVKTKNPAFPDNMTLQKVQW